MIDETKWERKEYELTCLSPVHIGNGTVLKDYEYLYDGSTVYFLSEKEWIRFLQENNLFSAYLKSLEKCNKGTPQKLTEWLQQQEINGEKNNLFSPDTHIEKQLSYASAPAALVKSGKRSVNDIAVQVKNVYGVPYIPGSSIKGALHTAILWHRITADKNAYQQIWKEVKNGHFNSASSELEKMAISVLNLTKKNSVLNSAMRGLQISDALLKDQSKDTIVIQKLDASYRKNKKGIPELEKTPHNLPLFRECIPKGRKFRFTVKLDKNIGKQIGLSSLDTLWEWEQKYCSTGMGMLSKVFQGQYFSEMTEAEQANLLLGGGTGFLFKTVFYALAQNQREGQKILAGFFDKNFRQRGGYHHLRDDVSITPRTLHLAKSDGSRQLLGLVKIQEAAKC